MSPCSRGVSFLLSLCAACFQPQFALGLQVSFAPTQRSQNGRYFTTVPATATTTAEVGIQHDVQATHQVSRSPPPSFGLSEIFVAQALSHQDLSDEQLWVPQTETVSFRPLCLSVSGGYYVNLLRVRGSGMLSRHRHPGPVHGFVLKGKWRYLEHDWIAQEGSYVFEPPGEIHTLVVPDDVEEMITLFFVTGSLLYCDESGNVVGADDVFTKLEMARKHYTSIGLGEGFVKQFVR